MVKSVTLLIAQRLLVVCVLLTCTADTFFSCIFYLYFYPVLIFYTILRMSFIYSTFSFIFYVILDKIISLWGSIK